MSAQRFLDRDIAATLQNRTKLRKNRNLLYWYENLYAEMFAGIEPFDEKRVLEIGSGTSPLKYLYPTVLTSDIMPLDYLDYVFDAHNLHIVADIADGSLDLVTCTNVLHHLRSPIDFLLRVCPKLKTHGQIRFAEPYFSLVSTMIFRWLHPEPVRFDIADPVLKTVEGPLSSANQALPYLIFFTRADWRSMIEAQYTFSQRELTFFSALSYMMTGGISRTLPIPHKLYRSFFKLDNAFSKRFPQMCASFFIGRLVKK